MFRFKTIKDIVPVELHDFGGQLEKLNQQIIALRATVAAKGDDSLTRYQELQSKISSTVIDPQDKDNITKIQALERLKAERDVELAKSFAKSGKVTGLEGVAAAIATYGAEISDEKCNIQNALQKLQSGLKDVDRSQLVSTDGAVKKMKAKILGTGATDLYDSIVKLVETRAAVRAQLDNAASDISNAINIMKGKLTKLGTKPKDAVEALRWQGKADEYNNKIKGLKGLETFISTHPLKDKATMGALRKAAEAMAKLPLYESGKGDASTAVQNLCIALRNEGSHVYAVNITPMPTLREEKHQAFDPSHHERKDSFEGGGVHRIQDIKDDDIPPPPPPEDEEENKGEEYPPLPPTPK